MAVTLIDSNVLIDVISSDPVWSNWSAEQMMAAGGEGDLVINQIVFGEVCASFEHIEEVDAVLPSDTYRREDVPWAAAFLASRAFRAYRRQGGTKASLLPDFFIGAHASLLGYRLLTRDCSRYRTYFPDIQLIAPSMA
jgi:predicted nucleic acid-binding protein